MSSSPKNALSSLLAIVLLLSLTAAPAMAQPAAAAPSAAASAPLTAAPLAVPWQPWDGDTMAWQLLGGAAGGVAGALTGLLVTAGYLVVSDTGGGWDALAFGLLGGMVGGGVGMGVGTWWTGDLTGGDGSLGWTLLGTLTGTVSGFALGSAANEPSVVLGVGLLGGVAGGIVAYHLTADPTAPGPLAAAIRVGTDGRWHAGVPLPAPRQDTAGRLDGWQLSLVSGRF